MLFTVVSSLGALPPPAFRRLRGVLLLLLFTALLCAPAFATVYHVRPDGTDAASALNWADAVNSINDAISKAQSGDQVWVSAGIYNERIELKSGVAVYGGFVGTETLLSERYDTLQPIVIIDGGREGSVVTVPVGADSNTILDGFVIRNGKAQDGGGLYSVLGSPTIRRCVFLYNEATAVGGAAYFDGGAPTISHCAFAYNSAALLGGAIFRRNGTLPLFDSVLMRNEAAIGGGAVFGDVASLQMFNNTVVENLSGGGGAIRFNQGTLLIANSIVAFNDAGIGAYSVSPYLVSNCVYGNESGNYLEMSDSQGTAIPDPTGVDGNISVDPLFIDRAMTNVHLLPNSPCRNAGNDNYSLSQTDYDGEMRVMESSIDIGADEIDPNEMPVIGLTLSPTTVTAGESTRVTVTLAAPAAAGGSLVTLTASNPAALTLPATVTVPAGESTYTFDVPTAGVVESQPVMIIGEGGGGVQTATLQIVPAFIARDVALAPDGSLRVLQVGPTGVRILKVSGSSLQYGAEEPIGIGRVPVAVAAGIDGKTHLLWDSPGGTVSLMTFDASGVRESDRTLGSYPGVTSKDIAVAGDGSVRILQVSATLVRILKVSGGGLQYGQARSIPAGWDPVAIASGSDNKTRLLWVGPAGAVSLMTFDGSGVRESYQTLGSYPGVLSKDIAVAADGSVRILQLSASQVRILKVSGGGLQYGQARPIPFGWMPVSISSGLDDKTYLLWGNVTDQIGVMTMNAAGMREAYTSMNPN